MHWLTSTIIFPKWCAYSANLRRLVWVHMLAHCSLDTVHDTLDTAPEPSPAPACCSLLTSHCFQLKVGWDRSQDWQGVINLDIWYQLKSYYVRSRIIHQLVISYVKFCCWWNRNGGCFCVEDSTLESKFIVGDSKCKAIKLLEHAIGRQFQAYLKKN